MAHHVEKVSFRVTPTAKGRTQLLGVEVKTVSRSVASGARPLEEEVVLREPATSSRTRSSMLSELAAARMFGDNKRSAGSLSLVTFCCQFLSK